MTEVPMGDTSGCPPTFSLFPPFLPTVIKQRLTSSRYTLIRAEPTPSTPSQSNTMSFNSNTATGASTPRPSSAGSASTARNSDDSFGEEDVRNTNRDILAVGASGNCEVDSGLRWNRVSPALNLLRYANFEAQQPNCESRLVRSLYLDSITYLLSALPDDLSSDETLTLRRSLPEKLKPAFTPDTGMGISGSPHLHAHAAAPYPPLQRSYLHRLLAAILNALYERRLDPFISV
ncbi:uncharacterized protein DSM5745_01934 [Aspergillus mulundensis]|uniref:Uncharacterized protein n=1 Tax=Aspergillus mulundensis TaxID=1810919 RepID=A0A3D8SV66_9EURO|nr:Uncharacterized protein DSM5745_01934 [Aspergillus mulundensis]RDW90159.1 Uncharacterized protein DSM5745_01934 [Aspergillus mulundensis]